ncbi:hypothetical protein U1Q18_002178 [Sarracenia purpurea var. burkii]
MKAGGSGGFQFSMKRVGTGSRGGVMEMAMAVGEKPGFETSNGIVLIMCFKEISGLKDGVLKCIYKDEDNDAFLKLSAL